MSVTIHKYVMPMPGTWASIPMPAGAKFLATGVQEERVVAWFEVDLSMPQVTRHFEVFPTGMTFQGGLYLGTETLNGWFVGHLYEVFR